MIKRLLLSVPTYGPVDPIASRHLRSAIMHAAIHGGVQWVGDLSPDRMKFDASRNTVVKGALDIADADAVLWVDSDVVLPVDAISRLVAEQQDFITGIYFQRYPPHYPLIANFDPAKRTFSWFIEWPENVVAPIDGCGFGCVLTSTALLRAMAPPWFAFEQYSEDFDFCLKAARAGFQLRVHTGVLCGHLRDPEAVTATDFLRVLASGGLRDGSVRPQSAA